MRTQRQGFANPIVLDRARSCLSAGFGLVRRSYRARHPAIERAADIQPPFESLPVARVARGNRLFARVLRGGDAVPREMPQRG